jgi:hypothetical protein
VLISPSDLSLSLSAKFCSDKPAFVDSAQKILKEKKEKEKKKKKEKEKKRRSWTCLR